MTVRSKNWTISILLMLGIMKFKESILKRIIDPRYFIKPIPLDILISLAISIILIVSVIEIYKRKYDNI